MQAEKPVQRSVIHRKATSEQGNNFVTNSWKGCKKVSYNSCCSKGHLTPN